MLRHQSHRTADVFTPTVRSMGTAHSKQAAMPRSSASWKSWSYLSDLVRSKQFLTGFNVSVVGKNGKNIPFTTDTHFNTFRTINTQTLFGCDQLHDPPPPREGATNSTFRGPDRSQIRSGYVQEENNLLFLPWNERFLLSAPLGTTPYRICFTNNKYLHKRPKHILLWSHTLLLQCFFLLWLLFTAVPAVTSRGSTVTPRTASVLQVNWLTRNNFILSGTEVYVFTSCE
jgi:hypothetical protein